MRPADGLFVLAFRGIDQDALTDLELRIWLLAEVVFEQKELGNPPYGCELGAIDYAQVANACGAQGLRCTSPAGLRPAIDDMLRSPRTALLEVHVDPAEPVTLPSHLVA